MKKPRVVGAFEPPEYNDAIIGALKSLASGVANEGQQRLALNWIIEKAAQTYDQPFRPGGQDGDRDTAFACGRMFVGQQIVKVMKLVAKNAHSQGV